MQLTKAGLCSPKGSNDTASWYRYFDATAHAEYIYRCVQITMEKDLPAEVDYLRAFDWFSERVSGIVDMPHRTLDLLHRFLRQNGGVLSERARMKEFAQLTADEVARIEAWYAESLVVVQGSVCAPSASPVDPSAALRTAPRDSTKSP